MLGANWFLELAANWWYGWRLHLITFHCCTDLNLALMTRGCSDRYAKGSTYNVLYYQPTFLPTYQFLPVPTNPPGTDMQKGSPSNALHWITNQSDARQCKAKIRVANCNALRWSHSKGHLMASLSAARQSHGHCDVDGHCEACRQPGPRRGVSLLTYPETCLVLIRGRVDDGKLLQNVK